VKSTVSALEGGIIDTLPVIDQGQQLPGSLIQARNFEPSYIGGYARIKGYSKFDSVAIPGSGAALGSFVFNDGVVGVRGREIYFSSTSGWNAALNSTLLSASPGEYIHTLFDFGTDKIIIVNGADFPVTWDGTTFVPLTNASFSNVPTAAEGVTFVALFKNHLFFCKDEIVFFSSPGDETDWSSGAGGGAIAIGKEVTAMIEFRDSLYLLGPESIHKITGNNDTDFAVESVTSSLGILGPRTLQEVNADVVYLSTDGVRTIAGTERIGDVNLENISKNVEERIRNFSPQGANKELVSTVVVSKNQYRLFISDSTQSKLESPGLLAALRRQSDGEIRWEWFETKGIQPSCAGHGLITGQETIVHGDFAGFVYKQEDSNSFDGNDITSLLQFPFWSMDDPEIRKTLHKLRLYLRANSEVTPTYSLTLDFLDGARVQPQSLDGTTNLGAFSLYGSAIYGTNTYSVGIKFETEYFVVGTCFNVSLSVSSSDSNAPFVFQTMNLQYSLGGRK